MAKAKPKSRPMPYALCVRTLAEPRGTHRNGDQFCVGDNGRGRVVVGSYGHVRDEFIFVVHGHGPNRMYVIKHIQLIDAIGKLDEQIHSPKARRRRGQS